MYPLNYVFCYPKHRISGVSDYLAIRRNSPDLHPWKALGQGDGLRATHLRPHQRGEGEGHCRGFIVDSPQDEGGTPLPTTSTTGDVQATTSHLCRSTWATP